MKTTFHRLKCLSLLLLFSIATATSFAQTVLPFTLTDQGHIAITAKLNGIEGNFIFDTGGGLTLITKTFSRKIGKLDKQDGNYTDFRATGEKLTVDLYRGTALIIGTLVEKEPLLTVYDVNLGPYDGLISLASFRNQPFTIDYTNKQLIFETPKSMKSIRQTGSIIPLQISDTRGIALTTFAFFRVNDKLNLQFSLDSGAGRNVFRLNSSYVAALGADTTKTEKRVTASEFNPNVKTTLHRGKLQSIVTKEAPKISTENIQATFIDGLIYDGIISINWMGNMITFDVQNKSMIVR